jgi:hypothetical protein
MMPMIKATRSNTTTRRALLAGAPAVAAAALAAGTAANGLAIAATSPSGDAELLALKPEFDRLFDEWVWRQLRNQAEHKDYVARHERVFGFPPADAPDRGDPERAAYNVLRDKMDDDYPHRDPDLKEWTEFHAAFNPLVDKVLSHTATTLDGLKLQTRALIVGYDVETWQPAEWDQAEDPQLRGFVQSACNVLGIPFPPLPDWREA